MENGEINLIELAQHFSNEDAAREYLEKLRWPDGPVCPHCGVVDNAYRLTPRPSQKDQHVRNGVWKCGGCREQFTVTVGTIFADSHIPLSKWLLAYNLLCSSKKGMSAHQLHRMLKVTYRSAWFMAHRIRYTMTQEPLSSKLEGIIEIDDTWIGGKLRKGRTREEAQENRRNRVANKASVVSVLQRGGRVQSLHVQRVTAENLKPIVEQMVAEDAHVMTDSANALVGALKPRKHDRVNHYAGEYARYEDGVCITTNSVEGFFGLLKRGINGVYHHVGQQHLHRYLTEFDFRYNSRKETDSMRTVHALKSTTGKRLMLRDSRQPN
ncbi:MAG: IS1595 family transposase [Terracidiphilus sp.]|jgi:transposase-like protein